MQPIVEHERGGEDEDEEAEAEGDEALHQQTDPCSVQPVQQITADYSKVPSITDLYRKQTKKLAYKPYLKFSTRPSLYQK